MKRNAIMNKPHTTKVSTRGWALIVDRTSRRMPSKMFATLFSAFVKFVYSHQRTTLGAVAAVTLHRLPLRSTRTYLLSTRR